MSIIGSSLAQSLAGLPQAERAESKDKDKSKPAERAKSRGASDDLVVVEVETAEAIRNLKSNDQEEAHEDRQQHRQYRPDGTLLASDQRQIDVQG